MPATKEEKLLASIDGTLKDLLKELKRQGKTSILTEKGETELLVDGVIEKINRDKVMESYGR